MRLLPRRIVPSNDLLQEVKGELLDEQREELERLREELGRLRPFHKDQIHGLAKVLVDVWLTPSNPKEKKILFDDPVWGHASVDEELSHLFYAPQSNDLITLSNFLLRILHSQTLLIRGSHTHLERAGI